MSKNQRILWMEWLPSPSSNEESVIYHLAVGISPLCVEEEATYEIARFAVVWPSHDSTDGECIDADSFADPFAETERRALTWLEERVGPAPKCYLLGGFEPERVRELLATCMPTLLEYVNPANVDVSRMQMLARHHADTTLAEIAEPPACECGCGADSPVQRVREAIEVLAWCQRYLMRT